MKKSYINIYIMFLCDKFVIQSWYDNRTQCFCVKKISHRQYKQNFNYLPLEDMADFEVSHANLLATQLKGKRSNIVYVVDRFGRIIGQMYPMVLI
jgi:hypothetical protein